METLLVNIAKMKPFYLILVFNCKRDILIANIYVSRKIHIGIIL